MANTKQLLKLVRATAASINSTTDNPEYKALLTPVDCVLNELLLESSPAFYLQHISAVLDWESSRLGDPADDIIWTQMVLSPYMSMPEFLKAYKAGTGRDVSEYRLALASWMSALARERPKRND